ncbi:type IIL restriction-modification enzyme MmeI, partial [Anaerobiospirillum sp. NML120449]|uniref:type IIL restriction-modification enzyme MmeI n=1 Tax=Anaerobiospirillum sp. NML120449 TaxID=2932817 RepID=UPI0032B1583E|nr:hypothetical protein [Anaerobiospirillum sp. NML120449]
KYKLGFTDLVTAWFVKASDFMSQNSRIMSALVATNSICQGQQVNALWGLLLEKGIYINFAYTSFPWSNDASGKAIVTCIIVGFSYNKPTNPMLFLTKPNDDKVYSQECTQISPYLTDCNEPVIVKSRGSAISNSLILSYGNMPADGGNLIFSFHEGQELLSKHPEARPFLKKFIGSSELMKGEFRYCLWLKEEDRDAWSSIPVIMQHVEACAKWRSEQKTSTDSYKLRTCPWRFREQNTADKTLVIPVVSSEKRKYIPIDFLDKDTIGCAQVHMLPNAANYDFGILMSLMHNVWAKFSSGRLKSDIRYSKELTFNTFVWPDADQEQHAEIEQLAMNIRMIRVNYDTNMGLGEMYNPDTMPEDLRQAHEALDAAVERAYRDEPFQDDEERLAFLLDLYSKAVAAEEKKVSRKTRSKTKKAAVK